MPRRPMEFGPIPGVHEGQTFSNRRELFAAHLHRSLLAGISGNARDGCDAIVLSNAYEDDADRGEVILYTGEGGRDPETNHQIANQRLVKGNLALDVSRQKGLPVRVIRGAALRSKFAPREGYRYDGLYRVERAWKERGKSGFDVWRFELRKIQEDGK